VRHECECENDIFVRHGETAHAATCYLLLMFASVVQKYHAKEVGYLRSLLEKEGVNVPNFESGGASPFAPGR